MADDDGTALQLVLPPDPRLLRVLRLVASGVASLADLDLASVEEVRVAVDELGSTLIGASTGASVEITFELTRDNLCVEGRTPLEDGTTLVVDPLTDRILDVVATSHAWHSSDGMAHGRIDKATTSSSPSAAH